MEVTYPLRVWHADIHRTRLDQMLASSRTLSPPLEPTFLACPYCGTTYFLDAALAADADQLRHAARSARARLAAECPDHAHRFAVH